MSTDYNQVLDTLVNLLATNTGRVVTRSFKQESELNDAEQLSGLYMVMHDNVANYPQEHRPGDLGDQRIMIIGICKVAEDVDSEEIEKLELAMLNELEALASINPLPDELVGLQILSATGSLQTGHPYGHVVASFSNYSGA